jgi:hypothetical protein
MESEAEFSLANAMSGPEGTSGSNRTYAIILLSWLRDRYKMYLA